MADPVLSQNPVHLRHGSNSGQPLTRRDGVLKVTGKARFAADARLGDAFATDIETLRDTLRAHLAQEEDDILPVAGAVLSQQEWDWMEEHTRENLAAHRKELGKDIMSLQVGLLIASVPESEREGWMRKNIPAPIRLLYLLLMKSQYDRAMRELYPDRPVPAMVQVPLRGAPPFHACRTQLRVASCAQ